MAAPSPYRAFIARAVELGAREAKIISAGSIVTAPWVRLKCQFGCGGYNSSCCCPPRSPSPEQTRSVIDCYRKAILAHFDGRRGVTGVIVRLEREIFLAGYYKALGFGAGPCSICAECPGDGCIHPEKARPSMEACGIDVYATARAAGFPIEVVKNRKCEENYYGVVLIE
jgi:predicted metal-binding protein